jgi:hypothetical protein
VLEPEISADERRRLHHSANVLREAAAGVDPARDPFHPAGNRSSSADD